MQNTLMYKDLLQLIFDNRKNHDYFRKYYKNTLNYQFMLRDYTQWFKRPRLEMKEYNNDVRNAYMQK